ncbi:Sodium/glucose cotransporter [Rubripirellula lacrimiformis]|uniref:Sodium/glucose cotransporter n=1 Tax=Rubripirellula lacrimiformis TaxID=1930273 RepID=A0A517N6A5_9BACT|nr:sodium:solute symporter family protein [Rubripirellula lacrimiformis]QDT02662.1 Sodium/glucose cotransporter [Rubripirellula lacrimiformis]
MTLIDYLVLAIYFAVMIGIGLWAMRGVKDQEDYFMGGRGFGKLLQTFAAFGAGTGAHEPVTVGRTGWTSGLSGVWSALMWLFVTPVYWITAVWYRRMRHLTLGDWFVERYQSKSLGAAYTLFAIVFYMFYLSTMFSAVAKFAVPLLGVETGWFGYDLKYTLVPAIAVVVILYGVLGGLAAAYITDLIQGLFIILLSVLLIPYGLWAIAARFGGPGEDGLMDGFRIMHERVSGDYFSLFAGPSSGEFPVQYILSLSVLALVGIVVQPHFIATGGGTAKTEDEARIGLVVGNFLKRLCTVGWALTALIALALLAGNAEIAADPDRVWGVAAREILGPLNLGLVGLMLACLLAAMMSSADCYMIVTSALVVRNVYAPYINPGADEKRYVLVGRLTGLIIIVGAAVVAMRFSDVFGQFKMAMELPILFAAPFWVGMYWRRANRTAVWGTMAFSLVFFFVLPYALPRLAPAMHQWPSLSATTEIVTTTVQRTATESDVARHEAFLEAGENIRANGGDPTTLGAAPPVAVLGQPITIVTQTGGKPIYWADGSDPVGEPEIETVSQTSNGNIDVLIQRQIGQRVGRGSLNLDFLLYDAVGIDLGGASKATLETLRLPTRVLLPFAVLIMLSLFTRRDDSVALDRYFAKMNTPVLADPVADHARLEAAYAANSNPRKVFPGTDLEFVWPTGKEVLGFVAACGVCGLIIGLLIWLAGIGA